MWVSFQGTNGAFPAEEAFGFTATSNLGGSQFFHILAHTFHCLFKVKIKPEHACVQCLTTQVGLAYGRMFGRWFSPSTVWSRGVNSEGQSWPPRPYPLIHCTLICKTFNPLLIVLYTLIYCSILQYLAKIFLHIQEVFDSNFLYCF